MDPLEGLVDDTATPRPDRRVAVRRPADERSGADDALVTALASPAGLNAFVAEVGLMLDVWLVDMWGFDRERELVVYEAAWRRDGASDAELAAVGSRVPLAERPDLALLLERRALVERHVDDPELTPELAGLMERRGYRSWFEAPLFDGDEVIGVLGMVERRAVRRLTDGEREQLERIFRLAALGVLTTRARRQTDEHAEHLMALSESGRALAASLDRSQTLSCLCTAVAQLLPGIEHEIDVWRRLDNGSFVRLRLDADATPDGPPEADDAPDDDATTGEPESLVLRAIARHRPAQARTGGEPTRLIVPLVVAGEAAGYVDIHGRPLRRFTPDEVAVLQVLGDHCAVALEYARRGRSIDRQTAVDGVTGFFNRWYFYERLYSETARAERYRQPLSIMLVGIDDYDKFVVRRGRDDADAVLKAIARLLTASLRRKVDVACVHGAGEFGLLLPNTPPFKPGAALVAQRLRAAIDGMELRNEDHELLGTFTLSIGVAGYPRHADDADELGGFAVEALAHARALGGNRLQVYGAPSHAFQGDEPDEEPPAQGPGIRHEGPLSAIILPPDWDD